MRVFKSFAKKIKTRQLWKGWYWKDTLWTNQGRASSFLDQTKTARWIQCNVSQPWHAERCNFFLSLFQALQAIMHGKGYFSLGHHLCWPKRCPNIQAILLSGNIFSGPSSSVFSSFSTLIANPPGARTASTWFQINS